SNSQCTLDTFFTSATGSGNNLTLTLALTFKPVFIGAKNVYMIVGNNGNVSSGWQAKGSWNPAGPPANVSVTPASGSGTSQAFTLVYSDPAGWADITYVGALFQTGLFGQNACYVIYVRANNAISLYNDAGTGVAGTGTPGTAGTLSNSQCSINTLTSSVSGSGNNLTLTLALSFKPVFA